MVVVLKPMKQRFKPCPFCASVAASIRLATQWSVYCVTCGSFGPPGKTDYAATRLWNRRKSPKLITPKHIFWFTMYPGLIAGTDDYYVQHLPNAKRKESWVLAKSPRLQNKPFNPYQYEVLSRHPTRWQAKNAAFKHLNTKYFKKKAKEAK